MDRIIDLWAFSALVGGIGYMCWIFSKQRLVARSQTWPAATGTISHSEMGTDTSLTGTSRTANKTYAARIKYRYMVGSRVYNGNTICLGGVLNTSFKSRAEERLDKYPEGATVAIYYNPANPKVSCLERHGEIAYFGYLIGGGIALFGALILLDIVNFGR